MESKIVALRMSIQKSSQEGSIIDLAQPPGEVELRKDLFASQFREIADSGLEIIPENEVGRREDQFIEMGDASR